MKVNIVFWNSAQLHVVPPINKSSIIQGQFPLLTIRHCCENQHRVNLPNEFLEISFKSPYLWIYFKTILSPCFTAGPAAPDCGQCWMLLVILNPSSALLLSLLSTSVVYLHCRNKGSTANSSCLDLLTNIYQSTLTFHELNLQYGHSLYFPTSRGLSFIHIYRFSHSGEQEWNRMNVFLGKIFLD